MTRVLLTGGTGFIGQHVYNRLLNKNIDLHITSRYFRPLLKNVHITDLLNLTNIKNLIKKLQPDILIHLAWDVTHDEFWTSSKNVDYLKASIKLFELFLEQGGKKIISTGTCAEYPTCDSSVSEDIIFDKFVLTQYGAAKKEVSEWLQKTNCDFSWLRIFGIYGHGEDNRRILPSMIRAIRENQEFIIKNPNIFCDYIYVDDLAALIVDCIYNKGLGIVNIGSGENYAFLDLYNAIVKYIKSGLLSIDKTINNPDINSRIPDVKKLHNYGYKLNFNFEFVKNVLLRN